MIRILRFLATKKSFMLFILLELFAFILIINSHEYAKTKTHSLQTEISGRINDKLHTINYHFQLESINDSLQKQNAVLLDSLINKKSYIVKPVIENQFGFVPAYVINNQYKFSNNIILINKGLKDSIQPGMGVISTNGIVGIVQKTSKHFSKIVSILNTHSKLNVSLLHTNHTGFLQWDGTDPNVFSVIDMPVTAKIKPGDTIITSGISNIFPKGIPVGVITSFKRPSGVKTYNISIHTLDDMTNIGAVYVVKNKLKQEFDSIIKTN